MIKKTDQTKKGVELMIPGIVIGVIVLVIVIWLISSYNGFVTLRNKTEEAFSAIDVSLKKRYDLIPNYVETVKGYAKHESETLEKSRSRKKSGDDSDKISMIRSNRKMHCQEH